MISQCRDQVFGPGAIRGPNDRSSAKSDQRTIVHIRPLHPLLKNPLNARAQIICKLILCEIDSCFEILLGTLDMAVASPKTISSHSDIRATNDLVRKGFVVILRTHPLKTSDLSPSGIVIQVDVGSATSWGKRGFHVSIQ
jgi:hypothetical protein